MPPAGKPETRGDGARGGGGSGRQARRGGDSPESPWGDAGDEAILLILRRVVSTFELQATKRKAVASEINLQKKK